MRIMFDERSVEEIRNLATKISVTSDELAASTSSALTYLQGVQDGLGPHMAEMVDAMEGVTQVISQYTEEFNVIATRLTQHASRIEEVIVSRPDIADQLNEMLGASDASTTGRGSSSYGAKTYPRRRNVIR